MSTTKSVKRSYNSSRRQAGAQLTRQAIAQAALQLFNERGYWGASIDAIAAAAAVAPETIYATFGNKREILHYLFNTAVGGDEAPVRLIDRPEQQAMLQETDIHRLVERFANMLHTILGRAAPVFAILAEAAKTEPELAALQERMWAERLDNMRRIARSMARLTRLRVTEAQAAEILWALSSAELFTLLTGVRQWTRAQYAAWLQDSLARLLFEDATAGNSQGARRAGT
jgi:TetR/AcrR family transcriptional regulator of autoinduction and epiphytic fitness